MEKSEKNRITVDIVRNLSDLKEVFKLRREAFVKERNIPENMEFDGNDFSCTHLLLRVNEKPAGTLRIRYFKDFPKIERLCIAKKYRGYGLPKYLLDYTEEFLSKKGYVYVLGYILKELKDYWLARGFELNTQQKEVKEGNVSLLPVIYPFKKCSFQIQKLSLLGQEDIAKTYDSLD